MRRILRSLGVAVACGSVALLGACTSEDPGAAESSPSASSPTAPSKDPEDLLAMLLAPEDLDGQWVVNEGDPHVITDAERDEFDVGGPADYPVCPDAPNRAADRITLVAPWTVATNLSWSTAEEPDLVVLMGELLVSGDPGALSAAVAVAQACPVEFDEEGFSQTPPVQLPVEAGDEAVVWRTGGTLEVSSFIFREWFAWVRVGDVIMNVHALDRADESADPVLTDEAFLDIVTTAADKIG